MFTVLIPRVEASRPRQNPARPSTVRRFLARLHRAVSSADVEMSASATEEARADFGLSPSGVFTVLLRLTVADFHHDEPSRQDPRQILWVFKPGIPTLGADLHAWVRIRETPRWYIISFHRSIQP